MYNLSGAVLIEDEFLRDGLQNEKRIFSIQEKLGFVADLENAGVRRIQCGSFVHPKWVPSMADTDELFDKITPQNGIVYTALILNKAGLDRALTVGVKHLSMSVSASETHSKKNLNRTVAEARAALMPTIEKALGEGVAVRAGIQSALGCGFEGAIDPNIVIEIARAYSAAGVHEINIADTSGLANPSQVYDLCSAVRDAIRPDVNLSLHLHDTRGMGIANMIAGLQAGVRIFDAALGGLGGCPFVPKATGNIATEDAVFTLTELGLETGIDWRALKPAIARAEALLDRRLPGRMGHINQPNDELATEGACA